VIKEEDSIHAIKVNNCNQEKDQNSVPIVVVISRVKVSCSGSFLRISAAIGPDCTPFR
jgi:hypothetical protein